MGRSLFIFYIIFLIEIKAFLQLQEYHLQLPHNQGFRRHRDFRRRPGCRRHHVRVLRVRVQEQVLHEPVPERVLHSQARCFQVPEYRVLLPDMVQDQAEVEVQAEVVVPDQAEAEVPDQAEAVVPDRVEAEVQGQAEAEVPDQLLQVPEYRVLLPDMVPVLQVVQEQQPEVYFHHHIQEHQAVQDHLRVYQEQSVNQEVPEFLQVPGLLTVSDLLTVSGQMTA